jgi:hypothetical protein
VLNQPHLKEYDMRNYARPAAGDSIPCPDAGFGEPAVKVVGSPARASGSVRSTIQVEAANEAALDIHAILQIASRERSAACERMRTALFTTVGAWFERSKCVERGGCFAASGNPAGLERPPRHFESTGTARG